MDDVSSCCLACHLLRAFAIISWPQLIHLCTLLSQLIMQLTRNAHEWISWGKMLTAAVVNSATCSPAGPKTQCRNAFLLSPDVSLFIFPG